MRGLSITFLSELQKGYLHSLVDYIKQDETLFLAIRENYINIYYRGGNLLKLEQPNPNIDAYKATFDTNYFKSSNLELPPPNVSNEEQISAWINVFSSLRHTMDVYFSAHSKLEREFQQLVARENSYSKLSNATDYFIVDIEYAVKDARFDMIAIKWISSERKKTDSCKLALIEMKYADGALSGVSGIKKHIEDVANILRDDMKELKQGAVECFKQLRELGLIQFSEKGNSHQIDELTNELPEFIFLLANHDPESTILKRELETILPLENAELKFAVSSFMGYGLFDENMKNLEDFKKLL
jgi:hypothetical protein